MDLRRIYVQYVLSLYTTVGVYEYVQGYAHATHGFMDAFKTITFLMSSPQSH